MQQDSQRCLIPLRAEKLLKHLVVLESIVVEFSCKNHRTNYNVPRCTNYVIVPVLRKYGERHKRSNLLLGYIKISLASLGNTWSGWLRASYFEIHVDLSHALIVIFADFT